MSEWQTGPTGLCEVTRDGDVLFIGTPNECFANLLKRQGQSTDWALKHEGYKVDPHYPPSDAEPRAFLVQGNRWLHSSKLLPIDEIVVATTREEAERIVSLRHTGGLQNAGTTLGTLDCKVWEEGRISAACRLFAETWNVPLDKAIDLGRHAQAAKLAQEKHLSGPGHAKEARETRFHFEAFARDLGFEKTLWEALWPTIKRSGVLEDIRPPR